MPIVVALDGEWKDVKVWTQRLEKQVWGFKVGSILFAERGPRVVEEIQKRGHRVFLDLKYHDIPNTVQLAVRRAFSWGVDLVTVHACGGKAMLEAAAVEQKKNQSVVAVTVLTSLDQKDLRLIGVEKKLKAQVLSLAKLSMESGIKGLVSSPAEVSSLREKYKNSILVTPGIRLSNHQIGDQKRTDTLAATFLNGSSLAVVGRALTSAKNWKTEWQNISSSLEEIF
jgi:orotidine-5'-phosphate decarboxylase